MADPLREAAKAVVDGFDPFDYEQGLCYWCNFKTDVHAANCPFDALRAALADPAPALADTAAPLTPGERRARLRNEIEDRLVAGRQMDEIAATRLVTDLLVAQAALDRAPAPADVEHRIADHHARAARMLDRAPAIDRAEPDGSPVPDDEGHVHWAAWDHADQRWQEVTPEKFAEVCLRVAASTPTPSLTPTRKRGVTGSPAGAS